MGKIKLHKKKEKVDCFIAIKSNIVQFDDMGYPLVLCIMQNGKQMWIDVGKKWAEKEIDEGRLKVLEWTTVIEDTKK